MKTIDEEMEDLQRGYSKITETRFMYNTQKALNVSCNRIVVFYLLYRETVGHTIFKCFFARRLQSVGNWVRFLKDDSQDILINNILPNLKSPTENDPGYIFQELIAWRFPVNADKKDPYHHGKIVFR
jgi:hypothetical protein